MKFVRPLLLVGAVLAALVLGAVAIGFNSSFQTWAARKALAAQPVLRGTLGSVAAGLNRIEVGGLRLESQGAVLTMPSLSVEVPLLPAAFSRRIQVRQLIARGWTLDLTHVPGAEVRSAEPPAAVAAVAVSPLFQGAFAALQLPADVSVGAVDLAGEVIVPTAAGKPPSHVHVSVTGGGLSAGHDGRFVVELRGTTEGGDLLELHGQLSATMDTPRTFGRLALNADATVSGPRFPRGVKLKARVGASRSAAGETYNLVLADATKELADIQADFAVAGARIEGQWKLDLHADDLAPFALGHELPGFTAVGQGSFETDATFAEIHAAGRMEASVDRLAVVRPELSAIGAVRLSADFDLLQHGDALRVERLNVSVLRPQPVLTLHALQAFEFNLRTGGLSVADPAQDLVWLSLQGVPLAWARPFLGDLAVTGDDLRGEFAASARDGGLTLHAKAPLVLNRLSVARAGTPLLNAVDLEAGVSADYAPQGWQVSVANLSLRSGAAQLLNLEGKAGRLSGANQPMKATGKWTANLPDLLAQPAAASPLQLRGGSVAGDFNASVGTDARQFHANLALTGLVAATGETLPAVTADIRVDLDRAGKLAFSVPVALERAGRKSDLLLAGTLTRTAKGITLDARLTSDRLTVEDAQLLAAPMGSPPPPAAATPAAPGGTVASDVAPFWQGVTGQITLALKKVVYAGKIEVSDVAGVIQVGEGALRLEGGRAGLGADSDLKVKGGVTFSPKTAAPYELSADLAVLNYDPVPAFRALDPAKLPTVEGRFDLATHLTGDGKNLADLAGRARGDMALTSKGGLFRALSSDVADKVQKTQTTVAVIGGILGSVTRKQDFENLNNKAQILTDIAKGLSEIPFDQLSVTATRDESLNVVLKDFSLISPEVRIGGTGQITYQEGLPLLAQPLRLDLNLASRGRLGDLMKRAGLLEPKQDNLGYTAFIVPLKIGGTLEETDTSDLRNALLNSALEKTGLLNTLLGK